MIMVLIEMRESAMNKAFDLIDETKESMKKAKMYLCALEEHLDECFDSSAEEEDENYEDTERDGMINNITVDELNYRRGMRSGMRHNESEMGMRGNMRRNMRRSMRRHYGRYSY
jgi:hypothetical protein